MANFQPMKQRFLLLLEDNLRLLSIRGRFLDYGCGSGDVAEFLLRRCALSEGTAFDLGLSDEEIARRRSAETGALAHTNRADEVEGRFDVAVLFDVLEHVPDAPAVLQDLHRRVSDDGWLFLTVPYNRWEWGIDDHFYGHLRRLSRRGLITLLENQGWDVIRTLDPTFPSFWLLRRLYLLVTRFSKSLRARHFPESAGNDLERTFASSRQSSWESMGPVPRLLSSVLVPWKLVRLFDLYFESVFLGFELFLVAQRRGGSNACEVCGNGVYSHRRFFDRTSRQSCGYCGSELLLPRWPAGEPVPAKRPAPWVERAQRLLRRPRNRRLERLAADAPERSALDVGHRDPALLRHLEGRGWRVESMVAAASPKNPRSPGAPGRAGAAVEPGDGYGLITLFHVVEHAADLKSALADIDRLLLPGGYLVLEYPSARSLLEGLLGSRWFGFDPPHHRLLINPVFLSDRLGLDAYRLIHESHLSLEYSWFIFAQSLANLLLPFQRDGVYRLLARRPTTWREKLGALLSLPVFAVSAPIFLLYQPLVSLLKRGCVVRQVFKKSDIGE
jgi:2-polyprenyl-3-methyl-5-hydroxy-6-metoxy-1,4-benzoquinol methylase